MDRLPIRYALWHDPTTARTINITTHIFNNGYYYKNVSNINLELNIDQPDMTNLKNCTATLNSYTSGYRWITISCDTLYNVSYVCQISKVVKHHQKKTLNQSFVSHKTCASGWFMIDGSDQCFSVMDGHRGLSYYDAQSMCRAENASIIRVEVANSSLDKDYTENRYLKTIVHDYKFPEDARDISREKKYHMLFGSPLSRHAHSQLPDIIIGLKLGIGSQFFVDIDRRCSSLEVSTLSILVSSEPETSLLRGWGVNCRYCTEPVDVTDVICEKPSNFYKNPCQTNHFTCQDGTCILSIYECDSVSDCFDGSDEHNCKYEINKSNYFVKLPCILGTSITDNYMCTMAIHALCDGIYSNATFKQEDTVCYKYKLNYIHITSLLPDRPAHMPVNKDKPDAPIYDEEIEARCSNNFLDNEHLSNYTAPRYNKKEESRISTLCRVSYYRKQSFPGDPQRICQNVACPEMFKCKKYFCIYMSAVCDGQYDCLEGDDEISCPISSCPGLLKCRGEKRCVSKKEICDNHIDCLYSMDDETDCHICPRNCNCNGYSVSCILNNSIDNISTNAIVYHAKGIFLKGLQRQLFVHNLRFQGLVYMNASFCGMDKIYFLKSESMVHTYIIIADFQHNSLIVIHFLKANIFKNVVYLELSSNRLSVINFGTYFILSKLVVLILKENPLRDITMKSFGFRSNLLLIDIQHVIAYSDLSIELPLILEGEITIKVSDSIICCLLKTIRCSSKDGKHLCFGLLFNLVSKISFYCICILTLLSTIFVLVKYIIWLSLLNRNANNKKKYYFVIWINHSLALLFISIYLVGIFVADTLNINMFFWRHSMICMSLNILLYTALESVVIFKVGLVLILSLQIIYPFKHQCSWLRNMALLTSMIWLVVLSTYFLTLIKQPKFGYMFDSICSIGMCGITDIPRILIKMACCIDFTFVAISIYSIMKTCLAMRKSNKTLIMAHTNKMMSVNIFSVILKIASPVIVELPFRLCLLSLLAITFSSLNSITYCKYLFLFALPANLFCTSLFFSGRNKKIS